MDRTLALTAQVAIAQGHRVEVTEHVDAETGESVILALVDLDTGIRYRRAEERRGESSRWLGRVLDCTVTIGGEGAHTALRVEPLVESASGVAVALQGADAAADAAKAEADRWGGIDRPPAEQAERFW